MSQENVEIVRRGYEHFVATGEPLEEIVRPRVRLGHVDLSRLAGAPDLRGDSRERGSSSTDWVGAWDDWELNMEELHEAGDQVVAILRQRGRAKSTGLPVDMHFGQVWTIRDGKQLRMQMYASPEEALEAAGLRE